MTNDAFQLFEPKTRLTSVVFASPHSGRSYSQTFLDATVLGRRAIRSSEDAFVDQLLDGVPGLGAPLLAAVAPRAFIDLNRGADELDPAVIVGVQSFAHNPRVASGLGVIPRVVAGGRAIYNGKIPLSEAQARIRDWWHPYHACLLRLLGESRKAFGEAILIDVHSMPHEAMEIVVSRSGRRPDIVVGDRYGAAAASHIVNRVEEAFRAQGLVVARNVPFAGAYIGQTYGRPGIGQHAIQIEIDRALYMDEYHVRPNANFAPFKKMLTRVLSEIVDIGRQQTSLAAE
jgi:N-formylglutamate amidohydrolase